MNVVGRELRARYKSLLIWASGIVLLLVASMAKFDTLSKGGIEMKRLLDQFPPVIQGIFGMNGLDISSLAGYFGVIFLYIAIMLAVQAGLLGADLVAGEERDRTVEFLHTKPRGRGALLTAKLSAGVVMLAILNGVTLTATLVLARNYASFDESLDELLLFNAAYGVLQVLFFAVGVSVAAVSRRPKVAPRVVTGLVMMMYLVYVITTLQPGLRGLGSISPLVHLDAKQIIASSSLEIGWVAGFVSAAIVCVVVAYIRYRRRDLTV